jgi:hypothetical protein
VCCPRGEEEEGAVWGSGEVILGVILPWRNQCWEKTTKWESQKNGAESDW